MTALIPEDHRPLPVLIRRLEPLRSGGSGQGLGRHGAGRNYLHFRHGAGDVQRRAVLGQVVLLLRLTAAFLFLQLCGRDLEHHTLRNRMGGVRLCRGLPPHLYTTSPPQQYTLTFRCCLRAVMALLRFCRTGQDRTEGTESGLG